MNQNMSAGGGSASGGKKFLIIIVVILILGGLGYYFYNHNKAYAPSYNTGDYQNPPAPNPGSPAQVTAPTGQTKTINGNTSTPDYTPPQSSTGGENTGSNIQVSEVDFDGAKFSPDPVKINVGDYIFFKNKSTVDFWPAPGPNGYPGFDSNANIAPGGEFKFQFTKAGSWPYYDYSHPGVTGTIIVSQ